MQMKDVRVWSSYRSDDQIGKNRYRTIHPKSDLNAKDMLIYLPMKEDNHYIHNFVALYN